MICWTSGGLCKERWILFDTPRIVSLFSSLLSLSLSLSLSFTQTPYYWPSQNPVDNDVEYGKPHICPHNT